MSETQSCHHVVRDTPIGQPDTMVFVAIASVLLAIALAAAAAPAMRVAAVDPVTALRQE